MGIITALLSLVWQVALYGLVRHTVAVSGMAAAVYTGLTLDSLALFMLMAGFTLALAIYSELANIADSMREERTIELSIDEISVVNEGSPQINDKLLAEIGELIKQHKDDNK